MECPSTRIAFWLPTSLNRCLAVLPWIEEIHEKMPNSTVSALLGQQNFFEGDLFPEFHERILLRTGNAWQQARRIRRNFDVLVNASSDSRAEWIGWLAGIPHRIPFSPGEPQHVSRWLSGGGKSSPMKSLQGKRQTLQTAVAKTIDGLHLNCGFIALLVDPLSVPSHRVWEDAGRMARRIGEGWRVPTLVTCFPTAGHAISRRVTKHAGGHALIAPPASLTEWQLILQRAELILTFDDALAPNVGRDAKQSLRLDSMSTVDQWCSQCESVLQSNPAAIQMARAA